MPDPDPTLDEIRKRLRAFREERDWNDVHTLKELATAISVEAGELQELFLWRSAADEAAILRDERARVEEELADVLIFCLNFADVAGIDPLAAIRSKMEKNRANYPVNDLRASPRKDG